MHQTTGRGGPFPNPPSFLYHYPVFLKKRNIKHLAYIALLLTTIIWAAAGPVIKLTLEYIPPISFLFYRFLIVCVIVLPFFIWELKKEPIAKQDLPNLIVLGLLSQTVLIICFLGYNFTNTIEASLISVMYPIIAIAAASYFYKETVGKMEKVGVIIATFGAIVVIFEPLLSGNHITEASNYRLLGNLLILLYQFAWLVYIIWSKRIMGKKSSKLTKTSKILHIKPMSKDYSPTVITLFTFYVGLASFIPLVLMEAAGLFGATYFSITRIGITGLLGLLYMAILSSIVACILFQWGLDKAEVTDTALFTYLGPVFTFPVAFMLLSEIPTLTVVLGAAIIASGVLIAERYKS